MAYGDGCGPNLYRRALGRRRRSNWGCCGGSFPDVGRAVLCQVRWERAASCLRSVGPLSFARRLLLRSGCFDREDVEGAVEAVLDQLRIELGSRAPAG
jgi:hypothetical protein